MYQVVGVDRGKLGQSYRQLVHRTLAIEGTLRMPS